MPVCDPLSFNFVRLHNFEFPGGASVFEYKNHTAVNGEPDFLRLNLYLSKDHDYVTIWFGLLEPVFAESRLKAVAPPHFDFYDAYVEGLFKGYIDSHEIATHVFHALRIGFPDRYATPQILNGSDGELRCEVLT